MHLSSQGEPHVRCGQSLAKVCDLIVRVVRGATRDKDIRARQPLPDWLHALQEGLHRPWQRFKGCSLQIITSLNVMGL